MKICWDNLEKLKYNGKYWYKRKNIYIFMESCCFCNEPYLTNKGKISNFCSKSCSKQNKNNPLFKHGYGHNRGNYSVDRHLTYNSWQSMKQRCLNPNHKSYEYYKDIMICERWLESFENFLEDMGERPKGMTLDRIDNNGHYEPSNCKWSTPIEQANNKS